MQLIIFYMRETFLNLLPALPIIILIRTVLILFLRMKGFKTTIFHEIGTCLFLYFMIALFSVTIDFTPIIRGTLKFNGNINLIPFKGINIILQSGELNYIIINILGNIFMFIPIGFLIPLLWKKTRSSKVVAAGFMISLFIEFMQLFSFRGTDIDDLILNTFGAFLGYIIFRLFYMRAAKFADKFLVKRLDLQ